ncbi:MAG: NAD(P)H-hydrate dehydratase [Acidimicrobiaceae bacterium]|nr:NAD(P)H-hydrate dehydratase [Acidimicrobiaceae bacterium]
MSPRRPSSPSEESSGVIPVCTPDEMAAVDAASPEPLDVLVDRAGAAVARAVLDELGGGYGRRVAVLVGKGSNGADGRVAAERLGRRGVRTSVVDASSVPKRLPPRGGHAVDLVVDAAYGTGLGRPFEAPSVNAPVLAVDLPSGLDGLTGEVMGRPLAAKRTVTFAAIKPGLLFGGGPELAGRVEVVDLGLDMSGAAAHLLEDTDIAVLLPNRPTDAHKWQSACWVVAGSPGMEGAAGLAASAALRAGSGYVRLSVPGGLLGSDEPVVADEVVHLPIGLELLLEEEEQERFASMVVGPGIGTADEVADGVRQLVASPGPPTVVDGDGLTALADCRVDESARPLVLTPHDGEYLRLTGRPPGPDRMAAARSLAADTGAVTLLKGPTTVVAAPDGRVLLTAAGDARLATAGTGDVLSGIIGAFLARGVSPLEAAATAAHVHGRLATAPDLKELPSTGVVAGDLSARLVSVLAGLSVDGIDLADQTKGVC